MIYKINLNQSKKIRIIMLHGWQEDNKIFSPLLESLHDYELLLFDLPGFGHSPAPNEAIGSAGYSRMIYHEICKLPNKPSIFIGHSFGTRLALQIAAHSNYPILGLILLATTGIIQERNLIYRYRSHIIKFLNLLGNYGFNFKLRRMFLYLLLGREYRKLKQMRHIMEIIHTEDLTQLFSKIKQKAILFHGQYDKHTPPSLGKKISAHIAHSELFILKNCNHHNIISAGKNDIINSIKILSYCGD